jgi:hypothetical protein
MSDLVPGAGRPAATPLAMMRTQALVFLSAPVLMGVAVFFAVPSWTEPPLWVPAAVVLLAVVAFGIAETLGFRVQPIRPGTPRDDAARAALAAWQARGMVRFALCEATIVIGLVLSFVVASRWPYLVGFVVGMPLLAYEVLPSQRTIAKLKERLEADGGLSYLGEALRGERR